MLSYQYKYFNTFQPCVTRVRAQGLTQGGWSKPTASQDIVPSKCLVLITFLGAIYLGATMLGYLIFRNPTGLC